VPVRGKASDSDKKVKRDWVQERVRSMDMGRGSVIPKPSDRPAEVGRDLPRAYVRESKPFVWDNHLELAGIGSGARVSSAEVMRRATANYSRLVREEAVREPPVAESEVSVVAAKDSRSVREEAVGSSVGDSEFLWWLPKSRWCSGGGQEAGRHALWPPLEWPASPGLVEMWSSHRGGRTTGTVYAQCLAVAYGHGS